MITTEIQIQAEFFKFCHFGLKNKVKMNLFQSFPSIFYLNLSLDVLDAFLVRATVLSHGFSFALLIIAKNKYHDSVPLRRFLFSWTKRDKLIRSTRSGLLLAKAL